MWLPRSIPFVGFKRAKQRALETIRTADIATLKEPHTIKCQKEDTKHQAVKEWTDWWHQLPRNSLIYQTTLLEPPDGRTIPIFRLDGHKNPDQPGQQAKCSRATQSTLYRLATGHAFVGAYTQRFFPQHTPDQVACPCGKPVQTIEHVLLHCPRHTTSRRRHLTANGRPHDLPSLFTQPDRIVNLLRFLEETGACASPQFPWEPG